VSVRGAPGAGHGSGAGGGHGDGGAGGASGRSGFERYEFGRALRKGVPRQAHEGWTAPAGRADPLALLEASSATRVPDLVPIRYGRMVASPFAFLRGSAVVMASDLASTSTTGLAVQVCGDAHVANYGLFATPERRLVFDVNDFDETLPGPWEWDVKRLATSVAVVARQAGLGDKAARSAAVAAVNSYRVRTGQFAAMGHLDIWYSRIGVEGLEQMASTPGVRQTLRRGVKSARRRTTLQAIEKLTTVVDGRRRLVDDPPLLVHVGHEDEQEEILEMYRRYVASLADDRRHLIERYRFVDCAFKVVGVGSVGTRCFLVVLQGIDADDVILLQFKEADRSALEPHVGASRYENHGRRVVEGQRLMQVGSDLFLGWGTGVDGADYYFRQFRDMKGSFTLDGATPDRLTDYGRLCGWSLARAHARSGEAATIAGYLGTGDRFDRGVGEFAIGYAAQTEQDHAALVQAVKDGRVEATTDV
jgi:uncharacterized protein (DUF2252 family)